MNITKKAGEPQVGQSKVQDPTPSEASMNLFSIDLDRLRDDDYMEVITGSEGWASLNRFLQSELILRLIDQLKSSGVPDSTRDIVIQTLLRNLSLDAMADLREAIETSQFLDALISALGDHST